MFMFKMFNFVKLKLREINNFQENLERTLMKKFFASGIIKQKCLNDKPFCYKIIKTYLIPFIFHVKVPNLFQVKSNPYLLLNCFKQLSVEASFQFISIACFYDKGFIIMNIT